MKQEVIFRDLSLMGYREVWDYQEELLRRNLDVKAGYQLAVASNQSPVGSGQHTSSKQHRTQNLERGTQHFLLFCEHPPVYTLGKSGKKENILITEEEMTEKGIGYFHTNRGGDITFHGPGQLVGYPILDLEKFYTDIGKYLRSLEEVIILTLSSYGLRGERSAGETGVWIEPGIKGKERKICALGVRCSRWVTMHGFAFNVNTDLHYFDHIVPCGIKDKQVTSLQKELGFAVPMHEVHEIVKDSFEKVFECSLVSADLLV
jgi:lipoyl(octanoyl) transferase